MLETVFEQSYQAASRLAAVRSAAMVRSYGLPKDSRPDLAQEGLLELWRKRTAYDPARGNWRTFAEPVVNNRLVSLVRTIRSSKAGCFRGEPLESAAALAAPLERPDLRIGVWQVLDRVAPFDRTVALSLMNRSVIETGRELGVSRATVYRVIERLRSAFLEAGFGPPCPDTFFPQQRI